MCEVNPTSSRVGINASSSASSPFEILGLCKLQSGIDITTYDVSNSLESTRKPIFNFTYDNETTTVAYVEDEVYKIPDQVQEFSTHLLDEECDSFSSESSDTSNKPTPVLHIIENIAELHNFFSNYICIMDRSETNTGEAVFNPEFVQLSHSIQVQNQIILQVCYRVETLSMHLESHEYLSMTLNEDFKARLDSLPPEYNAESESQYLDFITEFGTHYFSDASLGGVLSVTIGINKSFLVDESHFMSKCKIYGMILDIVQCYFNNSKPEETLLEKLQMTLEQQAVDSVRFSFNGGNVKDISTFNSFEAWRDSLPGAEVIVDGAVRCIAELCSTKEVAVSIAMKSYILKQYLKYLRGLVNSQPTLQDRINKLLTFVVPSLEEVKVLGEDIETRHGLK